MAGHGYGYVLEEGLVAFRKELDSGEWGKIDIAPFRMDEPTSAVLLDATPKVAWKLALGWSIEKLARVLRTLTADELSNLDQAWDSTERRFHFQVAVHEDSEDETQAAAAGRLRTALLSGAGTAQTVLPWEKEVDFGRKQVKLASEAPLSDDVALLGLEPFIDDISAKTEAMAKALRDSGSTNEPRSNRIREALTGCRQSFNRVHDDLLWHLEHAAPGAQSDFLNRLLSPMEALLERYPVRSEPVRPNPTDEPQPTGDTPS